MPPLRGLFTFTVNEVRLRHVSVTLCTEIALPVVEPIVVVNYLAPVFFKINRRPTEMAVAHDFLL